MARRDVAATGRSQSTVGNKEHPGPHHGGFDLGIHDDTSRRDLKWSIQARSCGREYRMQDARSPRGGSSAAFERRKNEGGPAFGNYFMVQGDETEGGLSEVLTATWTLLLAATRPLRVTCCRLSRATRIRSQLHIERKIWVAFLFVSLAPFVAHKRTDLFPPRLLHPLSRLAVTSPPEALVNALRAFEFHTPFTRLKRLSLNVRKNFRSSGIFPLRPGASGNIVGFRHSHQHL